MSERRLRAALIAVAIVAGTLLRLDGLASMPLAGDEHHSVRTAAQDLPTLLSTFDNLGSHVLLPLVQHLCRGIFGPQVWSLRLVALVPGIAALILIYPLGRGLVGQGPALVATLLLAVNPMHVYYSHFARPYALVVLGGMGLVHALARLATEPPRPWAWRALVVLCATLLVYAHLSTLGFVLALALAHALSEWRGRGTPRALVVPLVTFALAGGLTLALYLPVWGPLQDYLSRERASDERGPLWWMEIPTLLAGGLAAGWTLVLGLPLGLGALARRRPRQAALVAAAVVGPLVLLLLARPFGMAYAYSRYLIVGLPFALLCVAWVLVAAPLGPVVRRAPNLGPWVAPILGLALALVLHLSGPLAPWRKTGGPFGSTYLALHPLPAFDAPWPGASPFYRTLAGDLTVTRVIEAPLLRSRTALLYRSHQLVHGKEVLIGVGPRGIEPLLAGPYARFDLPDLARRSRAQFLIYHRAVGREIRRYWRHVYGDARPPPPRRRRVDEGLMERNRRLILNDRDFSPPPLEVLGRPVYADPDLLVWRLQPPAGGGQGGD